MTANVLLAPPPVLQFFNNAGQPNAGGSVLTQVGGVNYPTYQDQAGNTPLPNPIPLNSRGEISNSSGVSCQLFLTVGVTYVFTQYDAGGNQINQASWVGSNGAGGITWNQGSTGAVTRTVQSKLQELPSVLDFGAKGDGATDDTAAIQAALNACTYISFPAGYTFKTSAPVNVPTTCLRIDGDGAFMVGPGKTSGIDGFTFNNFYQGGGTIAPKGEKYVIPSMNGYRNAVSLTNSAFLRIYSDTIENCVNAWYILCNNSANYAFELELESRFIFHLTGSAFYCDCQGNSNNAFQGNLMKVFYADDMYAAVYQNFASTGTNGNINNVYDLGDVDQTQYVVYCSGVHSSEQLYKVPNGVTSPINSQMFVNIGTLDAVVVGGVTFVDSGFTAATNFTYAGWGARPFYARQSGAVPALYVDPVNGSDTTGTGAQAKPFATIQKAINTWTTVDLNGGTVYISLANGTYSVGGTLNQNVNGQISIVGNTGSPSSVVINGSMVTAGGVDTIVSISGLTLNGGVLAQNGGTINIGAGVVFGTYTGGVHINAQTGGIVNIQNSYTVNGSATNHYQASLGGLIVGAGATNVAFSGSVAYTVVANAQQSGQISVPGISFNGASVTGQKYSATLNGVIYVNGGAGFPGSIAGSTATGGQYA